MKRAMLIGMVLVAVSVFSMLDSRDSVAQVALADDAMVFLSIKDGAEEKIVICHKPSRALLLYGHTSKGLQLQQIRNISRDISFAELKSGLSYDAKGYKISDADIEKVRREIQKKTAGNRP